MLTFHYSMTTDALEALLNDPELDEETQFKIEEELNARHRDWSDPAVIGERQYREDGGQ